MAIRYIQPVAPNYAEGLVARVYVQTKKEFGALVEPFTLHSPLPELLAGAWSACRESLLVGNVSRAVKEAVAATVSRINRCPYCVDAHTIMLNAASAHNYSNAIIHHRDDQIRDPAVRSIVEWANPFKWSKDSSFTTVLSERCTRNYWDSRVLPLRKSDGKCALE